MLPSVYGFQLPASAPTAEIRLEKRYTETEMTNRFYSSTHPLDRFHHALEALGAINDLICSTLEHGDPANHLAPGIFHIINQQCYDLDQLYEHFRSVEEQKDESAEAVETKTAASKPKMKTLGELMSNTERAIGQEVVDVDGIAKAADLEPAAVQKVVSMLIAARAPKERDAPGRKRGNKAVNE